MKPHSLPRYFTLMLIVLACIALSVQAYDQPTVNLGLTSFVDGGAPAGPGFYYAGYLQYYSADRLVGHPNPAARNTNVDVLAYINQFLYQSNQPILWGGKWGLDVILPVVNINSDNPAVPEAPWGLGDLLIGPYLQWDPMMGENGPVFMHRVELQMMFPTGKYDVNKALNPGSNFFSFNPYWSGTWFITPRWTASTRIHYLWNATNKAPYSGLPGAPSDTQAGQAWHMNFASAYEVVPKKLRVGLNGYYFRQITDSKTNSANVTGYEQVLGVGPGVVGHFGQNNHLFFNLYFENNVRNRPDGTRGILRWVHHF